MNKALAVATILFLLAVTSFAQSGADRGSRGYGVFNAANYNYGVIQSVPPLKVAVGNSGTGSQSYTISSPSVTLGDGRVIFPLSVTAPITIDVGSNSETVTPTAVSGCNNLAGVCTITASFSNAHGQGAPIFSGTQGLQEAINDAFSFGGGEVVVDNSGFVTDALLKAAIPYHMVSIRDSRAGAVQYWNIGMTAITYQAAPATLTAVTALPSATPVGAYGTGTYHLSVACVDAAGQEGAGSADFSEAGLATGSFIFTAPAAQAGCVGYTIYISLTGGTYSLAYQVPLTAAICGGALTKIETITPACPVTNATYGQTGSNATVTAITLATSPVVMQLGGVSGTLLTGNPNGRTTYGYVSGGHLGSQGVPTNNLAFTVGGIGSATPIAIGTVNIPGGLLNLVGKQIRVCGKELNTDVNSSAQNINIYLDAAGSNVNGSPVKLAGLAATGTGTAAAYAGNFCKVFQTSVAGAGATAGSIIPGVDFFTYYLVSSGNVVGTGSDTIAAAVASLNLAGTAGFSNRLSIVHTNTTGNATPQLQSLTLEVF